MKILLCSISLIFLFGCAGHIPAEDIYIRYFNGKGIGLLLIEKGYLDQKNKGKTWKPVSEFKPQTQEEKI